MKCNTEFKILIEALENSHLFSVCHFLTTQYISDCQQIMYDTELLNTVPLLCMVKWKSILC